MKAQDRMTKAVNCERKGVKLDFRTLQEQIKRFSLKKINGSLKIKLCNFRG